MWFGAILKTFKTNLTFYYHVWLQKHTNLFCILLHFYPQVVALFLCCTIHIILPLKEDFSAHSLTNSSTICLPHFLSKGHSNRQRLFRRYTTRIYRYPASPTAPAIWPMWMLTNLMHGWWRPPQITLPLTDPTEGLIWGSCACCLKDLTANDWFIQHPLSDMQQLLYNINFYRLQIWFSIGNIHVAK